MPAATVASAPEASRRCSLAALRVAPGEHAQLHRLAADRGLSVSDLIRQALRESAGFRPDR